LDKIGALDAFVHVARKGSFTDAGTELSLSASAVTKKIVALETWLGVRLLQRTTHGVSLTDDGALCLGFAQEALSAIDTLEQEVARRRAEPTGHLRVAMPYAMGSVYLLPALPKFLADNPGLLLDLRYADDAPDLIEHGLDVAVRIGEPKDSRLVARLLAQSYRVTCATPEYLSTHGTPTNVAELGRHNCIALLRDGRRRAWRFRNGDTQEAFTPAGTLQVNSGAALREAVMSSVGIVQCNSVLVAPELQKGTVVPVLTELAVPSEGLYAVYLQNRQMVPRVRVVVRLLEELFAPYRRPVGHPSAP
jgi:LysR family transcriptional regulator, regulator for bpeEF and oprC